MKNRDCWKPSKYVYHRGRLSASRDPLEVGLSSRLQVDLVAAQYAVALKKYATGRLLDLGCGKVPLFLAYKEYVIDNTCVDWAESLHGNQHIDIECDLTKPLPLQDEEFDTIVLSDVLEHVPEPEKLWAEMARVLAPGGKVIVNVPFFYWIHEEPHDYYRYTEFALRRFVEKAGLELVEITPIGGAAEIIVDIFSRLVPRLPFAGRSILRVLQWLGSSISRSNLGKRFAQSTWHRFPYGYFLVAEKLPYRGE